MKKLGRVAGVLWPFALLLVVAHSAYAEPVLLRIESRVGAECEGKATLVLQCVGQGCESAAAVVRQVTIPETVPFEVSAERAMRARVMRDRCWAPDMVLTPDSSPTSLPVWRAATLSGTFAGVTPAVTRSIERIELTIQLPTAKGSRAFDGETFSAPCTISQQGWECAIPATRFDARIQAAGYTPWYFWRLEPAAGETIRLGEQRLESGGSVIGWVEPLSDGSPPVEVQLRVRTYATAGVEQRDSGLTTMTVRASSRGFFQFRNVPLGAYDVSAASGNSTSVEALPVDVDRAVEHKIRKPIQLVGPVALEVHIHPLTSTAGQPWTVSLFRTTEGSTVVHPVTESAAGTDGTWTSIIPVGIYVLTIVDPTGATQHREVITVDRDHPPIEIELERVNVKGTVTAARSLSPQR